MKPRLLNTLASRFAFSPNAGPFISSKVPSRPLTCGYGRGKNKLLQDEKLVACVPGVQLSNLNHHANCPASKGKSENI